MTVSVLGAIGILVIFLSLTANPDLRTSIALLGIALILVGILETVHDMRDELHATLHKQQDSESPDRVLDISERAS